MPCIGPALPPEDDGRKGNDLPLCLTDLPIEEAELMWKYGHTSQEFVDQFSVHLLVNHAIRDDKIACLNALELGLYWGR